MQRLFKYQNAALDNVNISPFSRDSLNKKLGHRPDESAPNLRVEITPRSMSLSFLRHVHDELEGSLM